MAYIDTLFKSEKLGTASMMAHFPWDGLTQFCDFYTGLWMRNTHVLAFMYILCDFLDMCNNRD